MQVTDTAQKILEERYLLEGEETWEDIASRVSNHFGKGTDEKNQFFWMMRDMDGLPNSPALMNAGTEIESYSACYVLPVKDDIQSIFKYYSDAALISKSGGGVGANFSAIREGGATVGSTGKVASGPLSFMKIQDTATDTIKQGGKRRGANMGILDCDHPDIETFIKCKDEPGVLENFNLSVRVTDEFMDEVTNKHVTHGKNLKLWNQIVKRAWSSAEPGVLFGDTIEKGNLLPDHDRLVATNPCGEQPLFDYESCTLGSINLSNHVYEGGTVNWDKLSSTTRTMVLLLNRILDKSKMPIPECQKAMEDTRKIGVGIMGLHDMLIQLDLAYDSEAGRATARAVMKHIADVAGTHSWNLGVDEGFYGVAEDSVSNPKRRNAHLITIAPTGTLSMIADCSSGGEPYYAPVTYKTVLDGETFEMPNKWVKKSMELLAVPKYENLPLSQKILFKGAGDIHWEAHIRMQAELQKHVDSSISKTINMPNSATIKDVKEAYELAWKLGCKGVTVYRDGSRQEQVLSTESGEGAGSTPSDSASDGRGLLDDVEVSERCDTVTVESFPVPYKIDLPDKLRSTRYRIRDNNGKKVYFNVCTQAGQPVEVFARLPEPAQDSYWRVIGRLISLCLRYNIPLKDVCKQLSKSSSSVGDVPAKLARILDGYQKEATEENVAPETKRGGNLPCPTCGSPCVPEGGCWTCHECGWSKCT